MPEINPDLSDKSRCVSVHWILPVQCVLPRGHRENWHEAWHPESGNRLRYRRSGVYSTNDLHHGEWHDLQIPPPNGFCNEYYPGKPEVRCTDQYGHGWNHQVVFEGCRYSWNTRIPRGLTVDQLTCDVRQLRGQLVGAHARIERLEDDKVQLADQQEKSDDEFVQAIAERDRYRLAWQSAAFRAEARGEGIERIVKDRESYQEWLKQEQAVTAQLRVQAADIRSEILAEVVTWLTKKAREFRADGQRGQADTASLLASKVARGAVRPDNLQMLPPDFFEPGHGYTHRDGSTFRCVAVTTHPDGGERVALGWHTDTADWTFVAVRNIDHWNHEYDGVAPPEAPVPQHYDKVPDPLDGCHWCACGNRWPCKDAGAVTA